MKLRKLVFITAGSTAWLVLSGCSNAARDRGSLSQQIAQMNQNPESLDQYQAFQSAIRVQIVNGTDPKNSEPTAQRFWIPDDVVQPEMKGLTEAEFPNIQTIPDPSLGSRDPSPKKYLVVSAKESGIDIQKVTYTWLEGPHRGKVGAFTRSSTDDFWYLDLAVIYSDSLELGNPRGGEYSLEIGIQPTLGTEVRIKTKVNPRPALFDLDIENEEDGSDEARFFNTPIEFSQWATHSSNSLGGWKLMTEKITNPSSRTVLVSLTGEESGGSRVIQSISNHRWSWYNPTVSSPSDSVETSVSKVDQFEIWAKLVRAPGTARRGDPEYSKISDLEQSFYLNPGETVRVIWVIRPIASKCALIPTSLVDLKSPNLFDSRVERRMNGEVMDGLQSEFYWNRSILYGEPELSLNSIAGWRGWDANEFLVRAGEIKLKAIKEKRSGSVILGSLNSSARPNSCQGIF